MFIKDKYVSEELRNLAVERDLLFVTASQLNRGAVEEIEFDHHHIAGGISKVQTADNVVGIFTSNAMREKGRYQIQFMKTRSSSGVGQKVDLEFKCNQLNCEKSCLFYSSTFFYALHFEAQSHIDIRNINLFISAFGMF